MKELRKLTHFKMELSGDHLGVHLQRADEQLAVAVEGGVQPP